jgi:hypothetical protein
VRAEINDVYPAAYARERSRAVVGYSLTWFPIFAPEPPGNAMPLEPSPGGGMGGAAGPLGPGNQAQFGLGPRTGMGPMGSQAMGLHRSQGVVVRDRDGAWRLPMLFDPQSRTWLTPLSPRLAALIAPELVTLGVAGPG